MSHKISIIIPAYNEVDIIGETLASLQSYKFKDEIKILVVDDGSSDGTGEIVKEYPVRLLRLNRNQGKGNAIEIGLREVKGEIIALVDADLGESIGELEKLIKPVIYDQCDVAIGVLPVKGGGLGLVRWLADAGIKLFTGKEMEAPLSGQRVYKREVLEQLLPFSPGFGLEVGMDIELLNSDWKVKKIYCNFKHNITGKNLKGFLHRGKQFYEILKTLWLKRRYLWENGHFLKKPDY